MDEREEERHRREFEAGLTVIPAAPGFAVAVVACGDGVKSVAEIEEHPIIAFAVSRRGVVVPITPLCRYDPDDFLAVKYPDGRYASGEDLYLDLAGLMRAHRRGWKWELHVGFNPPLEETEE